MPSQAGGDLSTVLGYAGKAGKKAAEMGRFLQVNGCVNQEHKNVDWKSRTFPEKRH